MIRLAVAIMAHEKRESRIPAILEKLGTAAGDVFVSIDRDNAGPWPNARKCWEACPDDASHMLILQDDVLLCQDFYVGATRALRHRPNNAISFYANDKRIDEARAAGASWARLPASHHTGGIYGQAQCIPAYFIKPLLRWWDNKPEGHYTEYDDPRYDDWILGQFLKKNRKEVWATVPSLVEHDCPSESLIGYSDRRKVARWYIGDDVSALSIDWRVSR